MDLLAILSEKSLDRTIYWCISWNLRMCADVLEVLTPLNRQIRFKMQENIAWSRLFKMFGAFL